AVVVVGVVHAVVVGGPRFDRSCLVDLGRAGDGRVDRRTDEGVVHLTVVGDLQVDGSGVGHARRGAGPGAADLERRGLGCARVRVVGGGGGLVVTAGGHQSGDGEHGDRSTEGAAAVGADGGHVCSSSSRIFRSDVIASLSNPNGHSTTTVPRSSTT